MASDSLICFIDGARRFTLATNYKVMYSTLAAQQHLTVVHSRTELYEALVGEDPRITDHYVLVRNPYARLLSFYADKFQAHPPGDDESSVQGSHRVFFDALGVGGLTTAERTSTFRTTGFGQFVELLTPDLIAANVHLVPQSHTLSLPRNPFQRRRLARVWRPDRVLRMESDLGTLSALGIDVAVRINATPHADVAEVYNPEAYRRVSALYRDDFDRFGYPPWSGSDE